MNVLCRWREGGERRGGEGGREGGRGGRGGREGKDDCYTYSDGTTQSRHVLRNNVSQHSFGSMPSARRTMVRITSDVTCNSRTESQINS